MGIPILRWPKNFASLFFAPFGLPALAMAILGARLGIDPGDGQIQIEQHLPCKILLAARLFITSSAQQKLGEWHRMGTSLLSGVG